MPKRSARCRRKNPLFYSVNNSIENESLNEEQNKLNEDSENDEENEEEAQLKKLLISQLNELVFYKIEMPSSSSNKKIISCIDRILEIINSINHKNNQDILNHTFNEESKIKDMKKNIKNTKFRILNIYEVKNLNLLFLDI